VALALPYGSLERQTSAQMINCKYGPTDDRIGCTERDCVLCKKKISVIKKAQCPGLC